MDKGYMEQVKLMLDVLPEVGKDEGFALHGGTAINLFVRDMPRLSVDIDLTYVEVGERDDAIAGINSGLKRLKERVECGSSEIHIQHKPGICKLLITNKYARIKVEVNMVGRGLLGEINKIPLCDAAQSKFDVFCTANLVSLGQLYGGKICAALDRQHPRDLFDTKLLLENEGLTGDIKKGIMYGLVSSNRPTHELLEPRLHDHRAAFDNQFIGMTKTGFSYDDYEATRLNLIHALRSSLTDADKQFLLDINNVNPNWSTYDFEKYPSVKWKLRNLDRFKSQNPKAYLLQKQKLEECLNQRYHEYLVNNFEPRPIVKVKPEGLSGGRLKEKIVGLTKTNKSNDDYSP